MFETTNRNRPACDMCAPACATRGTVAGSVVSGRRRLLQSRLLVALLGLVTGLLAACSPTYDWREIQPVNEPFVVMLPGKPSALTRPINLDGLAVTMHMHGALVNGQSFTAAWLVLNEEDTAPEDRPARRLRALKAMQTGMSRNIGGTLVSEKTVNLPLLNASGDPVGQVPGVRLHLTGTARGAAAGMHAIFVGFGANLYQFVALGPGIPEAQVETFLSSIRLRIGRPAAVAAIRRARSG